MSPLGIRKCIIEIVIYWILFMFSSLNPLDEEPHHGLRISEKSTLNFSSSSFVICINLLHP